MARPVKVTGKMAMEMKHLRELGVPINRIAAKFGCNPDTVKRHTSEEDRDKQLVKERARQAVLSQNPEWVDKRRAMSRDYQKRLRAEIKATKARIQAAKDASLDKITR